MATTTIFNDIDLPARAPSGLVLPTDGAYDEARAAWNLTADQRPAAVCTARSVAQVQAALAFARHHGLRVATQTTGHLATALPSLEDAMLLRPALHDGVVDVDPVARVARIKAGARWGDVVDAVAPHGLTVMHGSSPSVGVIGYLLGGGLSFYGRAHGLAANHVRAMEVVTVEGDTLRLEGDDELLWALRGGGGAYAVVTAVELGLLDISEVLGGALFWPVAQAGPVLDAWLAWTREAPDSVTSTFRILCLPPVDEVPPPLRMVPVACVDGVALDDAAGLELVARLTTAAEPMLGGFELMPTAAVVRLHGDPELPTPGIGDGRLLADLDAEGARAFLELAGEGSGSPLLAAELRHLGGALAAPPAGAGARGHFEGRFLLFGVGVPMAPGDAEAMHAHLDRLLGDLAPWANGKRFLSFAERTSSAQECFPDASLERLARVRATYDPTGVLVAPHAV